MAVLSHSHCGPRARRGQSLWGGPAPLPGPGRLPGAGTEVRPIRRQQLTAPLTFHYADIGSPSATAEGIKNLPGCGVRLRGRGGGLEAMTVQAGRGRAEGRWVTPLSGPSRLRPGSGRHWGQVDRGLPSPHRGEEERPLCWPGPALSGGRPDPRAPCVLPARAPGFRGGGKQGEGGQRLVTRPSCGDEKSSPHTERPPMCPSAHHTRTALLHAP